jgi:metal-responsive CopG/Arc/MetJ family transcriptional regulator
MKKTIMVSLRLQRELMEQIDVVAQATGIRRTELINRAIKKFLLDRSDPCFAILKAAEMAISAAQEG